MNPFNSTILALIGGMTIAAVAVAIAPDVSGTLVFWSTLGLVGLAYALLWGKPTVKDSAVAAAIVFGGIGLWVDFDLYAHSSNPLWQALALSGTTFLGYLLVEAVRSFPAGLNEADSQDASIIRDGNYRTLFSPHSAIPLLAEPELV